MRPDERGALFHALAVLVGRGAPDRDTVGLVRALRAFRDEAFSESADQGAAAPPAEQPPKRRAPRPTTPPAPRPTTRPDPRRAAPVPNRRVGAL